MTNDPKDTQPDDAIVWDLTEQELEGVDGGITLDNGIKKGNRLKPAGTGRKLRGGSKRKRRK